eukprot:475611_1
MSTIQPIEWIIVSFMALTATVTNCIILRKELKKLRSEHVNYTTKWLKLFSLLTMICGIVYTFINFVRYFPIFCQFAAPSSYFMIANQGVFMNFYQISRIYYCFSQSKVYSKKGYPNYLFVIMYSIGVLIIISTFYPYFFTLWNTKCGINNKYEYFPEESDIRENPLVAIWANITQFIYIIWDIITLLLYVVKVCSFKQYQSADVIVYNRIMSILKRVLILTACYEISTVLSISIGIIRDAFINDYAMVITRCIYRSAFFFNSVVFNFSMYMMQQHNDDEYYKFLQILHKLRVHYICCCCRSEMEKEGNESSTDSSKDTNIQQQIEYDDTADIPVKDVHSFMFQVSLSTRL